MTSADKGTKTAAITRISTGLKKMWSKINGFDFTKSHQHYRPIGVSSNTHF